MNVVMIPSWFSTKENPTLGSFFLNQAKALEKGGNKVYILYYDLYSAKTVSNFWKYGETEETEIDGIKVYRKKVLAPGKNNEIYGCKNAAARAIYQLYKKYLFERKIKIDIIHAQSCIWAGYTAMKLSRKVNVPYIITEHSTMYKLRTNMIRPVKKTVMKTFQNAAKVIAVSDEFVQILQPWTKVDKVIPNVIETDRFVIASRERNKDEFVFLAVAYMHDIEKKGLPLLIGAFFELLQQTKIKVRLKIGGDGDNKKILIRQCEKLNIKNKVEFLGALSRDAVAKQMQQCDAFVLPSKYETFGVVYFEAMATGKPVIATATGGPDEYITPSNGLLIPINDKAALVNAMKKIMDEYDKYSPLEIRNSVAQSMSPECICRQLEQVYEQVIQD